jgi:hypothetical protein
VKKASRSKAPPAAGPKPTGRPPAPLRAGYEQIEVMAGCGLTMEEIALILGITRDGLYKRQRKDAKLRAVLKTGKAKADLNVIKGLYTRASMGVDTAAACFWLKNRRPGQWRDKRELELGGKVRLEFAFGDELEKAEGKNGDEEQDE